MGVVIGSATSQEQRIGDGYADARVCLQEALQYFNRLSNQASNPDAMLSDLMLSLAFGGNLGEGGLDQLLTSLLIDSMAPQLAEAFTPILLSNLGQLYALEGDYENAEQYLDEALQQIKAGQSQNSIAEVELLLPLLTDLLPALGTSLDPTLTGLLQGLPELIGAGQRLNAVADYNAEALVLNNLALVYLAQERTELAQRTFEEALVIYEEKLGSYPGAVNIHANLGWLAQQAQENAIALQHYEAAIALLASVRSIAEGDAARVRTGNPQVLNSIGLQGILSQQADVYALAANLYLQQDKGVEAFQAIERGRARLFRDMVSTGNARLPDSEAKALDRLREAFDLRTQASLSLVQIRAISPLDRQQIRHWESELQKAETLYQNALADLSTQNPQLLTLAPGVDSAIDLAALQSQLSANESTLIVYYIAEGFLEEPTDQLAVAWVIDGDSIDAIQLDTNGAEIRTRVDAVRKSIDAKAFYVEAADRLYRDLITPVKPYIQQTNLTIVPYSSLYYLPFATLWDAEAERYLIEDYTITYAPSVGTLSLIQGNRNQNADRMLAMANNSDNSLPNVVSEVTTISQQFSTTVGLNEQATQAFFVANSGTVDLIHLAAHGRYDDVDPLASFVELAPDANDDGRLQVGEIFSLKLAEANLVVLSACQTALGEQSLGDEITGLTRAFLYAGTPSIMTTLWSIEDKASEALMTAFYQKLRTEKSFAAALRAAQLDILSKDNWRDPFYWAAFTLHGDYLGVGERQANPTSGLLPVTTPTAINTPSAEATPTPPPVAQLEVLVNTLNVRSGPGTAYSVIGQLKAGNQVAITGQDMGKGWLEICCVDGESGWVIRNENYIHIQGETDSIPQK
jgi:CHAT domain-containing protein